MDIQIHKEDFPYKYIHHLLYCQKNLELFLHHKILERIEDNPENLLKKFHNFVIRIYY
jgi:hypothetical protein